MKSIIVLLILLSPCARAQFHSDAGTLQVANLTAIAMPPFEVRTAGIDIVVRYKKDRITSVDVTHVEPNSTADKAGVKPGMQIIKIEAKSVAGKTKEEFYSEILQQPVVDVHSITFLTVDDQRLILKVPVPDRNKRKPNQLPEPASPNGRSSP